MKRFFFSLLVLSWAVCFFWIGQALADGLTYYYDDLNRLWKVEYPDGKTIEFSYDNVGNRKSVSVNPPPDSDNDGLSDILEQSMCTDPADDDTDDDGLLDGNEDANHNGLLDADETDPCLTDTDGDGIQDGTERGLAAAEGTGTDLAVFIADADPATVTDPLLEDSDGDGLFDGEEDVNYNGNMDPGEQDPNSSDCDYLLHDITISAGVTRDYTTACSITAGPDFVIEASAAVSFQAGTGISLGPGFKAKQGSQFSAGVQ
ncbi:MAG: RHS repeat protein [Deltaproteobacteria bacterium]|nr:RHS repeat protein [Deltaproteobacteria bacterium]